MTKGEAIQAMKSGQKITHTSFTSDEWMTSDPRGLVYTFEDGVKVTYRTFWENREGNGWDKGYFIFKENKNGA